MGIKDFFKINVSADKTMDSVKTAVQLKDLKGQSLCIDAMHKIYSSILAMNTALTDDNGEITSHINTVFAFVIKLHKLGINQVWVFDGRAHELKADTLIARKVRAEKATNDKAKFRMQDKHIADVQNLLTMMGIVWIQAPDGFEAEHVAAYMTEKKICSYVLSGDSDVLAFRGNLLRPSNILAGKTKKPVFYAYQYEQVKAALDVSDDQFVELCCALGNDFCDRVPKFGMKTAYKKVKQPIAFTDRHREAIAFFKRDITTVGEKHRGEYDRDAVLEFLTGRGFSSARIAKQLDAYL